MKNKGMFLEELINKTNEYYFSKGIAFAQKRFTKIHIASVKKNKVTGFLGDKNYVDYFGSYKGKHFEFEAKTTKGNKLYFKNIRTNQIEFLTRMNKLNVTCFFIIYYSDYRKYFKVNVNVINEMINLGEVGLGINETIKKGQEIFISYPGILNYINLIIFAR